MTSMRDLETVGRREVWDGVTARLIDGERMTLAIVEIAPGKRVPEHFTIGDETKQLGPGGSWRILSNVPHHVDVGPEGAIVAESYAPIRADWAPLPVLTPGTPVWPAPKVR
jgi:quercetin dioxygenase-like cupin family protein